MLAVKRTRLRAALFAAVFGVVLLLSGLGVGLSGFLAGAADDGVRAGLAALTGSDGAFRVTIPLAADADAQDARVRAAVRSAVRVDGHAVPMLVARDVETLEAAGLDTGSGVVRSALASIPGLSQRALLVAGAWPTGPTEASMQADAAAALGVTVGEHLVLPGGSAVTVTATWRVRDPTDARWLRAPITLSGLGDAGVAGFVVIDPDLWPDAGVDAVARWTVQPDAARVTAAQLAAVRAAPDTVPAALEAIASGTAVEQDGRLQPATAPIERNVDAAAAVSVAPLLIVAVLGAVTLIELGRMLEQLRVDENALLRARGASRRRLAGTAAVEAAIAAAPAAVLGSVIALLIVLPGRDGGLAAVPPAGWLAPPLAVVVAIVALALAAARGLRVELRVRTGGARGSTIGTGAVVLVVLAAVVAVSQFLLYGSPLVPTAFGGTAVDPLAVSAPAWAIAALGLLAVAVFPLVARLLERRAARTEGLGALPMRLLARRSRSALSSVLLLSLATGGLVLSASYSASWEESARATRAVQLGTGVRVTALAGLAAAITQKVPGQLAAAPAGRADVQLGNSVAGMVELPSDRIADVVTPVDGAVDPAALARAVAVVVDRPRLPAGARGVVVRVAAVPASASPTAVDVTVVDDTGALTVLHGVSGSDGFAASLPEGRAPWTIRAVDLVLPAVTAGARGRLHLAAAGSDAPIAVDGSWAPSEDAVGAPGLVALGGSEFGVRSTIDLEGARVRLQPAPSGAARVPIAISSALAQASGLSVGTKLDLPLVASGGAIPVTVSAIVTVIPGLPTGEGVLADLGAVQDAVLRAGLHGTAPTQWWIATDDPDALARRAAADAPVGTVIETRSPPAADQVLATARTVVWIAAGATALLAMLAVAAGLLAELRARRPEAAVLRALGIGGRRQAIARIAELGAMLALGLLAGLVVGTVASALVVRGLARAAVPMAIDALPTPLRVDLPGGFGALGLLVVAAAVLLLITAVTVSRQARMAGVAEDRR